MFCVCFVQLVFRKFVKQKRRLNFREKESWSWNVSLELKCINIDLIVQIHCAFRWLPLLLSSRGLFGVLGTKTSFLSFLEPVLNRSQELQTKTNTSNRTRKKSICINQKRMILLDFSLKMLFFSKKLFLNVRFGIFAFVFSSWDLFFWKLDFPKSSKMRFSLPNSPNPSHVPPYGHSCNGYSKGNAHSASH